jgi:hypothetical protein
MYTKIIPLSSLALFYASAPLSAANVVVTDTSLTSGSSAITSDFVATGGATAEATLEALTDFASIQTYSSFGTNDISTTDAFIFAFTDAAVADIQITISGSIPASDAYVNNSLFQSSTGGSFRVAGNAGISGSDADEVSYRIDLGSYETDTFTAGGGVAALGFTLTGAWDKTDATGGATITYYNNIGTALSTQVLTNDTISLSGYTGFYSTGDAISYVEITFQGDSGASPVWGLDDLGMTSAIPEPSSYALLAAGLAGLMAFGFRNSRTIRR